MGLNQLFNKDLVFCLHAKDQTDLFEQVASLLEERQLSLIHIFRSGVQSVFIPSLSLFMLTRMIGGNRVITLGTAIEQHFLTTQNWGMGSTIGVVLILAMLFTMWATRERRER